MTCRTCRHFCDDPASIEQALPGLAVFSSAHASVRADDGLCRVYDVVTNAVRRCGNYVARA